MNKNIADQILQYLSVEDINHLREVHLPAFDQSISDKVISSINASIEEFLDRLFVLVSNQSIIQVIHSYQIEMTLWKNIDDSKMAFQAKDSKVKRISKSEFFDLMRNLIRNKNDKITIDVSNRVDYGIIFQRTRSYFLDQKPGISYTGNSYSALIQINPEELIIYETFQKLKN